MPKTAPKEPTEADFNAVVDSASALSVPEMTDSVLLALIHDLARKIRDYTTIATRYGFTSTGALFQFLKDNPEVVKRVKAYQAIWNSDENVQKRTAELACHGILEQLPSSLAIIGDTKAGPAVQLEAVRAHARIAGLDGGGAQKQAAGDTGQPFTININLGDRHAIISATPDTGAVAAIPSDD